MPVHADMNRRRLMRLMGSVAVATLAPAPLYAQSGQAVTVYKEPTCGCCGGWVRHMTKAGFAVTVYNRTVSKTKPLANAGAAVVDSPAAVAKASDVVLTCVTAGNDVLSVVLDETNGVIASIKPGVTVIDHSTVGPEVAVKCNDALQAKEAAFLDAPISGGDETFSAFLPRSDGVSARPRFSNRPSSPSHTGRNPPGTVSPRSSIPDAAHLRY